MLTLKEAGSGDVEKEYRYISGLPANETGFTNRYFGITRKEYEERVLPDMIRQSKGIDVPEGWVPCTEYFLWDDDRIVGLFRIRQKLNDKLRNWGRVYRIWDRERIPGKRLCHGRPQNDGRESVADHSGR